MDLYLSDLEARHSASPRSESMPPLSALFIVYINSQLQPPINKGLVVDQDSLNGTIYFIIVPVIGLDMYGYV